MNSPGYLLSNYSLAMLFLRHCIVSGAVRCIIWLKIQLDLWHSLLYVAINASRLAASNTNRVAAALMICDWQSLLSWQKEYCACGRDTPRDSYCHKLYTEPFIWTGNYKITTKSTLISRTKPFCRNLLNTSKEQAGRSSLSYKHEKESGDW